MGGKIYVDVRVLVRVRYDFICAKFNSTNSPIDEKMDKAAGKKDAGGKDDAACDINLLRSLLQDNGEPRADDGEDRKDGHGKTLPGVERERHVGSVSEKASAATCGGIPACESKKIRSMYCCCSCFSYDV